MANRPKRTAPVVGGSQRANIDLSSMFGGVGGEAALNPEFAASGGTAPPTTGGNWINRNLFGGNARSEAMNRDYAIQQELGRQGFVQDRAMADYNAGIASNARKELEQAKIAEEQRKAQAERAAYEQNVADRAQQLTSARSLQLFGKPIGGAPYIQIQPTNQDFDMARAQIGAQGQDTFLHGHEGAGANIKRTQLGNEGAQIEIARAPLTTAKLQAEVDAAQELNKFNKAVNPERITQAQNEAAKGAFMQLSPEHLLLQPRTGTLTSLTSTDPTTMATVVKPNSIPNAIAPNGRTLTHTPGAQTPTPLTSIKPSLSIGGYDMSDIMGQAAAEQPISIGGFYLNSKDQDKAIEEQLRLKEEQRKKPSSLSNRTF